MLDKVTPEIPSNLNGSVIPVQTISVILEQLSCSGLYPISVLLLVSLHVAEWRCMLVEVRRRACAACYINREGQNDTKLAFYLEELGVETLQFQLLFQSCVQTDILRKFCV